jgi:hypothetical protein
MSKFSISEITEMLSDIGIAHSNMKSYTDSGIALMIYGHPTIDIVKLGEFADEHGGMDMSLEEWVKLHSKFPIERWRYYIGIDNIKED